MSEVSIVICRKNYKVNKNKPNAKILEDSGQELCEKYLKARNTNYAHYLIQT